MPNTPPNYSTANSNTATNENTLDSNALTIWVSEATEIINNNINLGLFQCFVDVPNNVVLAQAIQYFQDLGYFVNILQQTVNQASPQFFGQIAGLGISQVEQPLLPTRLLIDWSSTPPNASFDITPTNYP